MNKAKPSAEQIQRYWLREQDIFENLSKIGVAAFVKSVPDIKKAFQPSDRFVRCIDEGTPGGIHLAGSGVLLGLEQAAKALKAAKVDGFFSHIKCGAASLYARNNGLDPAKADEYGKEWAKKIAGKLGVPYKGCIEEKALKRPFGFHIARVAYYDGSGLFDYSAVAGLPVGFIISRKYLDPTYALKEAETAVSIACSDHGFGRLITRRFPFFLIPIASSKDQELSLEKLKKELAVLSQNYSGRVIIDGFTSPL